MASGPLDFGDEEVAARRRHAHRIDPDADGQAPPPGAPPPRRRNVSQTTGIVVLVLCLVLGYVLLNTLRTEGGSSTGPAVGSAAPPFAAPTADGRLEGDVNVAREAGQGAAGAVPACDVRGPDVVNACELWDDRPAAIAFFATRGEGCVRELDVLERVARRHPEVAVAAVAVRGDREDVAGLARARGWRFPVAYDRDGVLANLYGVAVCPHVTFVARGGTVAGTVLGEAGEPALDAAFRAARDGRPIPGSG